MSLVVVAAVLLLMLVELQLSTYNERQLRARGAYEPHDDVYPVMRLAYPAGFVLMGIEAALRGTWSRDWLLIGLILFGWAKALKFWAIAHLGVLWTFKVLVVPGTPLVTSGPYRFVRHPNYVAVIGEIVAIAVALRTPIMGTLATVGFGWLLLRRIRVEERALGESHSPDRPPRG
jgi:isoprenylcysteine carboxyl methyltransferase (ICMT) family protein YpbQ